MKNALMIFAAAGLLFALAVPASGEYELEQNLSRLRGWLADKHTSIGDRYKRAQIFTEARKQYDRARELEADHRGALRGLGLRKRGDEIVENDPLPQEDPISGKEWLEAKEDPDEYKAGIVQDCADRCRRYMESALRQEDKRAARILATYLLHYAPDDEPARELRGHVESDDGWMPGFAKQWRESGSELLKESGFGEESDAADAQGEAIGTTFHRRESTHLAARTTISVDRAKMLHRSAEACTKAAMELIGAEKPFGGHRFTVTHLRADEYEAMLTDVLKLEGEELKFAKRLSGYRTGDVYGYMNRAGNAASADDMLGNTVGLRVLAHHQDGESNRAPWMTTGFGYLVTSRVLGSTKTQRYSLEEQGATATSHEVQPEFSKESGTPGLLREVALYNMNFERDVPLSQLIVTEINDMTQAHAAKAFAFMEWAFSEHPEKAKTLLTAGAVEPRERTEQIEEALGMSLDEVETALKEWVLAKY